ncbi:hypothetical protein FGO68_gene11550 [Halteria grandinella]|uniref:Uncharacterized protein n=1 Tax=Halteria grandinella TaxID=5974 RepID=A0A8J8P3D8_HALGN|nr:hypothetical protein FGO68_gene11550 [Halteria grandinella]
MNGNIQSRNLQRSSENGNPLIMTHSSNFKCKSANRKKIMLNHPSVEEIEPAENKESQYQVLQRVIYSQLSKIEKKVDEFEMAASHQLNQSDFYTSLLRDLLPPNNKALSRLLGPTTSTRFALLYTRLTQTSLDTISKHLRDLHSQVSFSQGQATKFRKQLEDCEKAKEQYKSLWEGEVYDRTHAYERFPYLKKVVAEYERMGGKLSADEQAAKRVFEKRYQQAMAFKDTTSEEHFLNRDLDQVQLEVTRIRDELAWQNQAAVETGMQRAGISDAPFQLIDLIQDLLEQHQSSNVKESSSMDVKSFSEHMDKRNYDKIVRELNIKAANSVDGTLKKILKKYQDLLLLRKEEFQCQTNFDGEEEMAKMQRITSQLSDLTWENQDLQKQLEKVLARAEKYERDYKDLMYKHNRHNAEMNEKQAEIKAIQADLDNAESRNREFAGKLYISESKMKRILDDYRLIQRRLDSMQKRAQDLQLDNHTLAEELKMLSDHLKEFTQVVIVNEGMPPSVHSMKTSALNTPPPQERVHVVEKPVQQVVVQERIVYVHAEGEGDQGNGQLMAEEVNMLNNKVQELQEEITSLHEKYQQSKLKKQELEVKNQSLEKKVQKLQLDLKDAQRVRKEVSTVYVKEKSTPNKDSSTQLPIHQVQQQKPTQTVESERLVEETIKYSPQPRYVEEQASPVVLKQKEPNVSPGPVIKMVGDRVVQLALQPVGLSSAKKHQEFSPDRLLKSTHQRKPISTHTVALQWPDDLEAKRRLLINQKPKAVACQIQTDDIVEEELLRQLKEEKQRNTVQQMAFTVSGGFDSNVRHRQFVPKIGKSSKK